MAKAPREAVEVEWLRREHAVTTDQGYHDAWRGFRHWKDDYYDDSDVSGNDDVGADDEGDAGDLGAHAYEVSGTSRSLVFFKSSSLVGTLLVLLIVIYQNLTIIRFA